MNIPSFKEDQISQIPALQLLMKLGFTYLTPSEALEARGGRTSNVILETVLKKQLTVINSIDYKGKSFSFTDANINAAVTALKDLPIQNGFMAATSALYDLIILGKAFEQTILGDKKSFSFKFIDWEHPENNVFHVTEEYSVLRSERSDAYRPDIIVFINGIPVLIIECKSPGLTTQKKPIELAIEQHERNQQTDGIRSLYYYSQILMGLSVNEAQYATTGTSKKFWSVWKEQFVGDDTENDYLNALQKLKNKPLPENERSILFNERYKSVLREFEMLGKENQIITEQDKLIYNLCRPARLLDIIHNYIVFDNGEKKIARYQQYFSIKIILERIANIQPNGTRRGGVIWHTQGSGKSLTMVMLAQMIIQTKSIVNPRIILVTDRVDLDDQISDTFKKCGETVSRAKTGEDLIALLESNTDAIITTVIHKFQSAAQKSKGTFDSNNIFVLVDESHRTQYGTFNTKMQNVFPKACYIAFTGTPLLKKERSTAARFGGIIEGTVYSITQAVADKAVVPLVYEGRLIIMKVNEKPMDFGYDRLSEGLTDYGKANLKRKFSSRNKVTQTEGFIKEVAENIIEHFTQNIQGTGFKAQLVAPNKLSAIRYRDIFKENGKISVELVISAPDMREGDDDPYEVSDDKVKRFWAAMMDKHGTAEQYLKNVTNSFKKQDEPEIIIVVDKLLTGFDAPINQVLYLTRSLREHTLLQAIARVNRLYEGKDYGYIIDYFGNLENLDSAIETYSGLENFDTHEVADSFQRITKEIEKLPQAHSDVWDIFKSIKNKYDEPAYEELLSDISIRYEFYEKLSVFVRLLKLAFSSIEFSKIETEKQIEKYKNDARFFLALRVSVKRRFFDELDYSVYEAQVQKLIDKHIYSEGEVLRITTQVNIFDKESRETELLKLQGDAAKADHIASRTEKAVSVKMNEDPVFYKRLSELIKQTIEEYRQQRINEAQYLEKVKALENTFLNGETDNIPVSLKNKPEAIAYFNTTQEILKAALSTKNEQEKISIAAEFAEGIDEIIKLIIFKDGRLVIDWQKNFDIKRQLQINLDDFIHDAKQKYDIQIPFSDIDELIVEVIGIAYYKFKY